MAHTIRDIARMAGVCIGTVSRVLNNQDKVAPDTRHRILELIERTGYRPSVLGRNLALQRTGNILIEMFNIADPYCARLIKTFTAAFRQRGFSTLTGDCDYDPHIEAEYLKRALDGHLDGMIISPLPAPANIPLFERLVASRFPVVLMDSEIPGLRANCVRYDDYGGARLAMDYLLEAGHRAIAFCGWRMEFPTVKARLAGYRDALSRKSAKPRPELILRAEDDLRRWDGVAALDGLLHLKRPPTAILAENDIMALACIHALQQLGLRVPGDMAVVAFGSPSLSAFLPMPLTNISLRENDAAAQAVEMLTALIDQPQQRHRPPRCIVIAPELVLGQSA